MACYMAMGGLCRTGSDRIDADTERSGLKSSGLRESFHGVFAGGVERQIRCAALTHGRGNVDDAAAALWLHDAQLVFQAQKCAEHIGVEHRRVAVGCLVGYRTRFTFGAGIVDGDIQAAEARDGLVDQIAHIVLAAHVRLNERRLRAEPAQFGFQGVAFGLVAAGPRRPIGTPVTSAALFFGVPVKRVNMPVSVGPGATPFTRIAALAISSATDLVMPSTACLLPT
jgi:hypothetical protein